MRLLSRFLIHASARFLEEEYSLPYTTILRIDKKVLENDIPQPKTDDVPEALIDEKFLGSSQGFVTLCLNASLGGHWRWSGEETAVAWMVSLTG